MRFIDGSSGWLCGMVSMLICLGGCGGGDTGSGGAGAGGNAGGAGGGAGGNTGGAGGNTGGAGGNTGGAGGNTGGAGGGGMEFNCGDYCTAINAINSAVGCTPFDCTMTCPNALAMFETQGCTVEGKAAFACIQTAPQSSWECDGSGDLSYIGGECGAEVNALTECQM